MKKKKHIKLKVIVVLILMNIAALTFWLSLGRLEADLTIPYINDGMADWPQVRSIETCIDGCAVQPTVIREIILETEQKL